MIQTIINTILTLLTFIIGLVIKMVMLAFPQLGLDQLSYIIAGFYGFMNQGINFVYFLLGESTTIFIGIIIILFTAKHIALPIVNLLRKIFIK